MAQQHLPCVVLFDGECALCHGTIRFLLWADTASPPRFQFAALQSSFGAKLIERYRLPSDLSSVLLLEPGDAEVEITSKSEAVLRMLSYLPLPWPALSLLRWCPICVRDTCYDAVASCRYRVFGRVQGKMEDGIAEASPSCKLLPRERRPDTVVQRSWLASG